MDEMDLMKKLSDVPSPSPEAYDRARAVLETAVAEPVDTVVRPKRWFSWPRAGVAAVGAAAVAATVVMGVTGGSAPTGTSTEAASPVVESPLVKLASEVKAAAAQPGDSSLVIATKTAPDNSRHVYYTLYTDKGQIFTGDSTTLASSVTRNDDQATPYNAKVMAAAREAANGDVEKARIAMITAANNALGVGLDPAAADKAWADTQAEVAETFRKLGKEVPAPRPRPTGKELENRINNHLWSNATYALVVGAANTEVRAGVLKLLATIKEVTVGETDLDGQRVLTITASPDILGGNASAVLTLNADNGLPIRDEVFPAKDSPQPSKHAVVSYESSRVSLADVAAGKI
ncbi:hypothetical protein [Saccharothrix coeruleofusca]|uniref:CU044_5270 family protein n=1 Tax=Saccharothrix coeruleofusca TaxID=33919 RepID=A0A918AQ11_9PSEU|nr:hypothetical protein [Saccharothrix coeruleofusca]MBP2334884.1 hypothetical protein [Saccharothrix coeruleofusca]GGP67691.1 hypothetical protein GCM10010185_45500 [Saccharothrix coeruleofusca]